MESDIEILDEVVQEKATSSKREDSFTACTNANCVKSKRIYKLEVKALLSSHQELKAEFTDLFRSKEKYKRLLKQLKQENVKLKAELNSSKSHGHLESNGTPLQEAATLKGNLRADVSFNSVSNECDEQKFFTVGRNGDEFNCFLETSPEENTTDLPSSSFLEDSLTNNQTEDYDFGIDQRCFQGVYASPIADFLETKYQESSVLSEEKREEFSRLTQLSKQQIIRWFHMRRPKHKRRFDLDTLSHLRLFYTHNQFPSYAQREILAEKTGLSHVQVTRWFKKQRERQKKQSMVRKPTQMWYKLLEESFNKNMYTSQQEITTLQRQTLLSKEQIEKWFKNRKEIAEKNARSAVNNETGEANYLNFPLVCNATSSQGSVDLGEAHDFICKQELNGESWLNS